jgi:hypothetical protein
MNLKTKSINELNNLLKHFGESRFENKTDLIRAVQNELAERAINDIIDFQSENELVSIRKKLEGLNTSQLENLQDAFMAEHLPLPAELLHIMYEKKKLLSEQLLNKLIKGNSI